MLLPGLDGTGKLFAPFVAALPAELEPVVLPLPAQAGPGYERLVEAVRERLPRGRPYALVAESFSGPAAIELAAGGPPGLRAVVLVASFHRRPAVRGLRLLAPLANVLLAHPPPAWATRRLLAGEDAPDDLVRSFQDAIGETSPAVLAARVRSALKADVTAALAACPVPILYVGGSRDRLLRPAIEGEMKRVQPALDVQLVDAPHLVLQRRPREAARIIARFLQRLATPGSER